MSFLELAASMHMHRLVQEYLVRSPTECGVCEDPLLVRLLAATVSDIVLHRQLRSYPLAIELLEALPKLVPTAVQDDPNLLSQLIVDIKSQYAVYQLYSMEEGADNMADFATLLTRYFDSVPSWGDAKVQEYIAELHMAAKLRLEGLAGSPEKKACYWQDYVLSEVQTQAVWESLEKGVTALLTKVEASLPKPLLVQAFDMVRKGPKELKQHSPGVQLKASIKAQAVAVLCSHLPKSVLTSKLKDLHQRHPTASSDAEQDTTASLDDCISTTQSDSDDQEPEELEVKLTKDLHNQTTSSLSKLRLLRKRGQSSADSISSWCKRSSRISDSSDTSSTAIPEQQTGGMPTDVSASPLKGPKKQTAGALVPFTCVDDSEEEGGKKPEAVEVLQKDDDMDAVASICEVFEMP